MHDKVLISCLFLSFYFGKCLFLCHCLRIEVKIPEKVDDFVFQTMKSLDPSLSSLEPSALSALSLRNSLLFRVKVCIVVVVVIVVGDAFSSSSFVLLCLLVVVFHLAFS